MKLPPLVVDPVLAAQAEAHLKQMHDRVASERQARQERDRRRRKALVEQVPSEFGLRLSIRSFGFLVFAVDGL